MKKDIMKLIKGIILAAMITVSAGSAFAFNPAPANPPTLNTDEPLNVSDNAQGKGITPNTYPLSLLNIKGTFSAEKMLVLFDAIINGQLTVGSLSQSNNNTLPWVGGKEPVCATTAGTLVLCGSPVVPAPTVILVATPSTITSGGSSTLTWTSTGATVCTSTNFSTSNLTNNTSGVLVGPATTTTYTITCTGPGGSTSATATVTVTIPNPTMTGFTGTQSCSTGADSINLSWNAVQGAGGYFLGRRSSTNGVWDGPWDMPYQTIPVPTTTFTDTNFVSGRVYYYMLRWYLPGSTQHSGTWSNTVGPFTIPSCFIDLTAGAVTAIPSTGTNIVFGVPINLRSPITNAGTISTVYTGPTVPVQTTPPVIGTFYNKFQLADGWHGPNGDQSGGINVSTIQNLVGYATAPGTSPAELGALNGNNGSAPVYAQKTFTNNGVFNYSVRACADTNTNVNNPVVRVTESNENNNCSPWSSLAIQYTPPTFPDYTGSNVTVSPNPIVGGSYGGTANLGALITNIGSTSNASFQSHFQVSQSPTFSPVSQYVTASGTLTLAGGASGTVSSSIYNFPIGTNYVRVCADQNSPGVVGAVTESNENNNCSPAVTVVATGHPLTVTKTGNASSVGTVASSPLGIGCGQICTSTAFTGNVILTANTNGSTFTGWTGTGTTGNSGGCPTNSTGTCTLNMNQARNVTATFVAHGSWARGLGTSYPAGTTYTLTACEASGCDIRANAGAAIPITIKGWAGGAKGSNGSYADCFGIGSGSGCGGSGGGAGQYGTTNYTVTIPSGGTTTLYSLVGDGVNVYPAPFNAGITKIGTTSNGAQILLKNAGTFGGGSPATDTNTMDCAGGIGGAGGVAADGDLTNAYGNGGHGGNGGSTCGTNTPPTSGLPGYAGRVQFSW